MEEHDDRQQGSLERLLLAHLNEQRRTRRWSIFFKTLGFVWLFLLLLIISSYEGSEFVPTGPHTALIDINGEIGGESGMNADGVIEALKSAFENKHTKGVVVRINSPGGSPVQSGQIYDEMRRLRGEHKGTPLHVVVDDICASGGYYIAAAADRIYVDKASMVGSIGVLMDGFGFTDTMRKLGIERRLLTAGENKGFLDPFSPLNQKEVEHARALLDEVHRQFKDAVRRGRGERLKEDPDLFTGLIWSGTKSIELGLADGLGSLDYVAREVIRAEEIVDYTPTEGLAERLARRIGTSVGEALAPWVGQKARLY